MTKLALAACLALACSAPAQAGTRLDFDECTVRSDYALQAHGSGVLLTRTAGEPRRVRMQDGRLWLDDAERELEPADRQRVRRIEAEVQRLMPEARAIAEEGLNMALDALTHVATSLGGDDPALRTDIEAARAQFAKAIDAQLHDGLVDEPALAHEVEVLVERLTPQIAAKVAALAISAALSGDEAAAKTFSQRAEAMGRELEAAMETRGKALGARAEALCGRLADIDAIESALDLRLADGAALDLLRVQPGGTLTP